MSEITPEKKKCRIKHILWLLLFWGGSTVCFLMFMLIFLLQISAFRRMIFPPLMSLVNSALVAKIEIEDLRFSGFGTLEIDNVRMTTEGDTLASVSRIFLDANLPALLDNTIDVRSLYLQSPKIKLLRNSVTGVWNFERIALPAEQKPDTPPSELIIKVGDLVLDNAYIDFIDSLAVKTQPKDAGKYFNPSKMQFRDFGLRLSSKEFNLLTLNGSAKIKSMQFHELNSGLTAKNISLSAISDGENIKLENFNFCTENTDLSLSANVHGIALAKEINDKVLQKAEVAVKIEKSKVSTADIEKFARLGLPQSGMIGLQGDFSGNLNHVKINSLTIAPENSVLNLSGSLSGILDGNLRYNAKIANSTLYRADLEKIMPSEYTASIPKFISAGLRNITADGSSESVSAKIDLISDLGNVKAKAKLRFSPDLAYDADLELSDVNIGKIIDSPGMNSHINGKISADGRGTDINKLFANIDLELFDTHFAGYALKALVLKAHAAEKQIKIDTCYLKMPKMHGNEFISMYYPDDPILTVSGFADLKNVDFPYYNLDMELKSFNLAELLDSPSMPEYFSASIKAEGNGFNPDSMQTKAQIAVNDLVFNDRSEFPFAIDFDINTADTLNKTLSIDSEIMTLKLSGMFDINSVSNFGASQGELWSNIVFNRMGQLENKDYIPVKCQGTMYPAKFNLQAEIKDINVVNSFLYGQRIYANADIDLDADITNQYTNIDIKKLNVRNFTLEADSLQLVVRNTNFASDMRIKSVNDFFEIDQCNVNLSTNYLGGVLINDLYIKEPEIKLDVKEESIKYRVSTNINGDMQVANSGEITFKDMAMNLRSDWLQFDYANAICLANNGDLNLKLENGKLDIDRLSIIETRGMQIDLSGGATLEEFDDLNIRFTSIDLNGLNAIMQKFGTEGFDMIEGKIETIALTARGRLSNPVFNASIHTNNIRVNDIDAGILDFDFEYRNKVALGVGTISNSLTKSNLFKIDVRSFPIDLAVFPPDSSEIMLPERIVPISLSAGSDSLPLALVAPFVPAISKLDGVVGMDLNVVGENLEHLNYSGHLDIPKFDFILDANNMHYSGKANIVFDNESVTLRDTKIFNDPNDYKRGSADLEGRIDLKGFDISEFNFSLRSNGLMVLNQASAKAIPMIYGNLLVATGDHPLAVKGNLNYLDITGDVDVLNGSLFMPQMTTSNSTASRMLYKVIAKDNRDRIYYNVIDNMTNDTLYSEQKVQTKKTDTVSAVIDEKVTYSDISENITMNMNFRILKPVILKMDLGAFGMLVAKIGTANSSIPLNFFYDMVDMKLNGEIELLDGSKLTYIKQFDTQGKISFPFGTVSNPLLNLTATYNGKSYVNDKMREFKVKLFMNGAFSNPSISFGYEMDGEEAKGDSTQISQDALFLIVLGRTKTELESGASSSDGSGLGGIGMGGLSAAFSKTMTELLAGTGNIESAEIDMGNGSNWQDARIKVSGKLFDNVQWRVGGDLNDLTNNNEFSLDIPLDLVLHPDYLNNIVCQISRSNNTQQNTMNKNQKEWEIKLKFGGSW